MPDDWATQFTKDALAKVDAFLNEYPEYTRQGIPQPHQGATNRVLFARCGEETRVFKVFCEAERKERECFGMRHWRNTGLVPEILFDDDPAMIIMSCVPGTHLHVVKETDGEALWLQACRETGRAIGLLTGVPLSEDDRAAFESRFYGDTPTLEAYLGRILDLGRRLHVRDPDFRGAFWGESLDFIAAALPGILSQPRVLYHQDVGNLHVRQGRFMGFYDLEMCRVGCAAMQLGSSLGLFDEDTAGWGPFREGWEAATGSILSPADLRAAAAASHLLCWREISRYMSYDGTPDTGFDWADPADPVRYRTFIEAVENMVGVRRVRAMFDGRAFSDSTELIREDRER